MMIDKCTGGGAPPFEWLAWGPGSGAAKPTVHTTRVQLDRENVREMDDGVR